MQRNVPLFGLLLGIIFPMLGMLIMYLIKFTGTSFSAFIETMVANHKVAAMVLSLSLLANAIPFIYYTNKRLDLTARGILIATMLYAVLIVLLKFVW
ncbi:MAG TPA: hypothetical protein PL009_05960 [Flavipsychrobacter sp.]|nr:hypothetical protein [Flavipsychrobacter sp.]